MVAAGSQRRDAARAQAGDEGLDAGEGAHEVGRVDRRVAEVGATIAVSSEFLVTVIAVIIGAVFLGERLTAVQVLGAVVIILGCSLVLGLLPVRRARSNATTRPS